MKKLWQALLTTIYPTPCLLCQGPLSFSNEILCPICLVDLHFELEEKPCPPFFEKVIAILPEDRMAFELLSYLKANSNKRLIDWVVNLSILRIAKEGDEPFFDSLFALPRDPIARHLASQLAKRLHLPFSEGEKALFIATDERELPHLEKYRKYSPHQVAYLLQFV